MSQNQLALAVHHSRINLSPFTKDFRGGLQLQSIYAFVEPDFKLGNN